MEKYGLRRLKRIARIGDLGFGVLQKDKHKPKFIEAPVIASTLNLFQ